MAKMYKYGEYYDDDIPFDDDFEEESVYLREDTVVAQCDACHSPIYVNESVLMLDDGAIFCAECAAGNGEVHDIIMEEFIYPEYYTNVDIHEKPNEEWLKKREIRHLKEILYNEYVREFKHKHSNEADTMIFDYGCPTIFADDELVEAVAHKWCEN
ncbi:MAG: hypothetical protein E7315_02115 [Clostridiales bacterium]|nr:hypothetical protein [Clostridiales bacterium]